MVYKNSQRHSKSRLIETVFNSFSKIEISLFVSKNVITFILESLLDRT